MDNGHDDIFYRLLELRKEEQSEVRRYIREMLWREDAGLDPVKPQVWFKAPGAWEPPKEATQVYEGLKYEKAPEGATTTGDSVEENPEEEQASDG